MGNAIVVIHGDSALRATAREALELAGHTVREAADFGAGWPLVETAPPELLLLPWVSQKPIREALARLRETTDVRGMRDTRVIVWTAQCDIAEAIDALELGADDCLGSDRP